MVVCGVDRNFGQKPEGRSLLLNVSIPLFTDVPFILVAFLSLFWGKTREEKLAKRTSYFAVAVSFWKATIRSTLINETVFEEKLEWLRGRKDFQSFPHLIFSQQFLNSSFLISLSSLELVDFFLNFGRLIRIRIP